MEVRDRSDAAVMEWIGGLESSAEEALFLNMGVVRRSGEGFIVELEATNWVRAHKFDNATSGTSLVL